MSKITIVLLVILAVLLIALVVLYFLGKKAQKKQAEQEEMIAAAAQQVNILVIDKGKMKLKDAGFPSVVLENTPKYLRRSKVPVVKAKVGPKIMTLMWVIWTVRENEDIRGVKENEKEISSTGSRYLCIVIISYRMLR